MLINRGDRRPPNEDGPLLGHALKIVNSARELSWVGSPREIVAESALEGIDLEELVGAEATVIDALGVVMTSPKVEFPDGPHAQVLVRMLKGVDQGDARLVESVVASWPDILAERDGLSLLLIRAAWLGDSAIASLLHRLGAETNAQGHFGMTALHWAAAMGWSETSDLLLAAGADRYVRSWFLVSALELAALNGQRGVTAILGGTIETSQTYSVDLALPRTLELWKAVKRHPKAPPLRH